MKANSRLAFSIMALALAARRGARRPDSHRRRQPGQRSLDIFTPRLRGRDQQRKHVSKRQSEFRRRPLIDSGRTQQLLEWRRGGKLRIGYRQPHHSGRCVRRTLRLHFAQHHVRPGRSAGLSVYHFQRKQWRNCHTTTGRRRECPRFQRRRISKYHRQQQHHHPGLD